MGTIEHIRRSVFGLTQSEFAEAIGVAQPTVSRWERGVSISHTDMVSIRLLAAMRGIEWEDRWFFELPEAGASCDQDVAPVERRHVKGAASASREVLS